MRKPFKRPPRLRRRVCVDAPAPEERDPVVVALGIELQRKLDAQREALAAAGHDHHTLRCGCSTRPRPRFDAEGNLIPEEPDPFVEFVRKLVDHTRARRERLEAEEAVAKAAGTASAGGGVGAGARRRRR